MKIITARRISQIFFFVLFLWFCVVTTLGENWWQLRGWPVNWLLQLDPLVGLGVLLATHTLYAGLLWAVVTIVLTLFLGRFFCGWVCPWGALQQFMGYWGKRSLTVAQKIRRNRSHWAQGIKYWILLFLLAAACADFVHYLFKAWRQAPLIFWGLIVLTVALLTLLAALNLVRLRRRAVISVVVVLAAGIGLDQIWPQTHWLAASLQTGLLDPIVLMHRSINLALLPIADRPMAVVYPSVRWFQGAGLIGLIFVTFTALSFRIPRFYCRFVCPLGALLGVLGRWALWRIGKNENQCADCRQCEADCDGACQPTQVIRTSECVLCLNCLDQCRHDVMGFNASPSAAGEQIAPDVTRRQVVTALVTGLAAVPMLRLGGGVGANWDPRLVRPPGALGEQDFLSRCIKCGQCMRICPTNVIHPAGLQAGLEGLWTPMLDFRMGTSGCQFNCVACSQVCPTAAIRPLTVDERMGRSDYSRVGPVTIGMAFIERGRCLPWSMDTPCIVCQENCPVSPKAIFTRNVMQPVRNGRQAVRFAEGNSVVLKNGGLIPDQWGTGDYYCQVVGLGMRSIVSNSQDTLMLEPKTPWPRLLSPGEPVQILIRLQQPYVDPRRCIGCGVCEHECPVRGRRAIRVTAENESRSRSKKMILS